MKLFGIPIVAYILWLLASMACGQELKDNPLIAKQEAERRGAYVEVVGGNAASDNEDAAFLSALAPPANDNDKWNIAVVTSKSCDKCEALKQAFSESPHLRPFVDVKEPGSSWAHYTVFRIEDQKQNWRFANIKFTAFPTTILQPPRNGRCGDPNSFIKLEGYNSDHATFAKILRTEIKKHALANQARPSQSFAATQYGSVSNDLPPDLRIEENPTYPRHQTAGSMDAISLILGMIASFFGPASLTLLTSLGLNLWLGYREMLRKQGKTPLVSDDLQKAIADEIKRHLGIQSVSSQGQSVTS